jgi:transcriptional regulator with XRE-family HTH domain
MASPSAKKLQSQEIAARFGENVRRARKKAGMSQAEVARIASLHRTEVGLIERGQRVVRVDTLIRIAGALEVPPRELLDGLELG